MPARERVLLVVGEPSSQTGGRRARPESPDRHAVSAHRAADSIARNGSRARPAQQIVNLEVLLSRGNRHRPATRHWRDIYFESQFTTVPNAELAVPAA